MEVHGVGGGWGMHNIVIIKGLFVAIVLYILKMELSLATLNHTVMTLFLEFSGFIARFPGFTSHLFQRQ